MRIILLLCVVLFLSQLTRAEDGTAFPTNQLAGTVTNEDGQPIEGAAVSDLWSGSKTTSDKDGHFLLKKVSTRPEPILCVKKPGYGQFAALQQPGRDDADVTLSNRTSLEGNILGPDGHVVPKALIRADSGSIEANGYLMPNIWTDTTADDNGHFKFFLNVGKYDVRVRVPKVGVARFDLSIAAGETQTRDITLEKGITFVARCVDNETADPVPGVHLSSFQHRGVEGTSDDKGIVTIEGMEPGKFEFEIESKTHARWWSADSSEDRYQQYNDHALDDLPFEIKPDMQPVTITLQKGVTITGQVIDPDGKPVSGATVAPAYTGSGNSITGDTRFSVRSKADGSFSMFLPAANTRQMNLVAHDGPYGKTRKFANGVGEPFDSKPGDKIEHVVLTLSNGATVKGHVNDTSGNPAPGKEVRAISTDGLDNRYYVPSTKTDKDGNYELKFIRPTEMMIQTEPFWLEPGQAPGDSTQTITLQAGETKEGVDLVARPDR